MPRRQLPATSPGTRAGASGQKRGSLDKVGPSTEGEAPPLQGELRAPLPMTPSLPASWWAAIRPQTVRHLQPAQGIDRRCPGAAERRSREACQERRRSSPERGERGTPRFVHSLPPGREPRAPYWTAPVAVPASGVPASVVGRATKVAVTLSVEFMVTEQAPRPVQAPDHPLKVYPVAGTAVSGMGVELQA